MRLPVLEAFDQFFQTGALRWIGTKHRAAYAGMFVDARGPIGSSAASEFDLSLLEVFVEIVDLSIARLKIVVGGPQCPPSVDEAPKVPEGLLVMNGRIALRSGDVLMAHELGEDVDRQASGQSRCRE